MDPLDTRLSIGNLHGVKYNTLWPISLVYRMLVRDKSAFHWITSIESNGSIGQSNVHWTLDLCRGSNGRMKCPMDKWIFRLGLHGGGNIIPYDVLSSSTACWLKTRLVQRIQWTNGISNGRMECPMDISIVFARGNIITNDVSASSIACWSQAKILALGICPLDSMDPLDTRMSIGHLTRQLDPMHKSYAQWTFRLGLHELVFRKLWLIILSRITVNAYV